MTGDRHETPSVAIRSGRADMGQFSRPSGHIARCAHLNRRRAVHAGQHERTGTATLDPEAVRRQVPSASNIRASGRCLRPGMVRPTVPR